jgi:threonine dehydrogenase-like Zn-dependent dehydrogenase
MGASIFNIPDDLSYEAGSLCEPFAVALNAVDISHIKVGQTAAVLGPGPIGLFTLQALKTAGAGFVLVAGTNGDKDRLRLAERLGADVVINVEEEDPISAARVVSGNGTDSGLDFVFEATGNPRSVPQALDMVRDRGKVVLIGIHSGLAQFNPTALVRGKKSIIGAHTYEIDTWRRTLLLFESGKIRVDEIVTHRLALSEAEKGFQLAANREAIKVLFVP